MTLAGRHWATTDECVCCAHRFHASYVHTLHASSGTPGLVVGRQQLAMQLPSTLCTPSMNALFLVHSPCSSHCASHERVSASFKQLD